MKEIELKAHVCDWQITEANVASFAVYAGSAEKFDAYWFNPALPPAVQTVRVRSQNSTAPDGSPAAETLVTCKRKVTQDAIEVNDETEFTVSDAAAFERFLHDQGYKIARQKTKRVKQWRYDNMLIELCAVGGLGHFIEIEILAQSDDAAHIASCRKKLLRVLKKSGVGKEQIETAFYSELLELAAAKPSVIA